MTQRWILASSNAGKLAELGEGLAGLDIILQSLDTSGTEESACTFVENALLKARVASRRTGQPAIADDSGLVVPALDGQPGIHSARFAGTPQNAEANIDKLLHLLTDTKDRHAWFHCALVWIRFPDDPTPIICEGQWHGRILTERRGTHGFGYDPIFFDPHSSKSAAELTLTEKRHVSHRGHALHQLITRLQALQKEPL